MLKHCDVCSARPTPVFGSEEVKANEASLDCAKVSINIL